MPVLYRWIFTAIGLAKRAAAEAGGTPIDMRTAQFVVGDGNGAYHEPEELLPDGVLHEVWRGPMNRVYVHQLEANLMVCEAIIPLDVGPFDIREAHIEDADGDVIAVGKYPLISKPDPASGAARIEHVRGGFRISNGGATVLQIDGTQVMATQEYVDQHALLTNPHGATHLPIAERMMLRDENGRCQVGVPFAAADIARKDTVEAAINNLINAAPGVLDTLYELATSLGNDPNFAATMAAALAAKETPVGAQGKVDTHANLTATHGATALLTPLRIMARDALGRAKIAAAGATDDIPQALHDHKYSHPTLVLRKSAEFSVPADAAYWKCKHDIVRADPYGMAALYDAATGKFTPGPNFAGLYLINWSLEMGFALTNGQAFDSHSIIAKNYGGGSNSFSGAAVDPYIEEWFQITGTREATGMGLVAWKSESSALVYLDADDYIIVATSLWSNGSVPVPSIQTTHGANHYGNTLKIIRVG